MSAGRIVAVCRSERAEQRVAAANPDAIVRLSAPADAQGLVEALRVACGGGADVVLDPVFGFAASAAAQVLGPGGRLVNLGSAGGETAEFSSALLRSRSLSILGYTNNALRPAQRAAALTAVLTEAAAGRLTVDHDVRPLAECASAWQLAATGGTPRLVLVPRT